jgi:hypothetical protein
MILTEQECKLFYDLTWSLQYYVNQKLNLIPAIKSLDDFSFPSSGLGMPTFKLCLTINAYNCENKLVLFAVTPSGAWY